MLIKGTSLFIDLIEKQINGYTFDDHTTSLLETILEKMLTICLKSVVCKNVDNIKDRKKIKGSIDIEFI